MDRRVGDLLGLLPLNGAIPQGDDEDRYVQTWLPSRVASAGMSSPLLAAILQMKLSYPGRRRICSALLMKRAMPSSNSTTVFGSARRVQGSAGLGRQDAEHAAAVRHALVDFAQLSRPVGYGATASMSQPAASRISRTLLDRAARVTGGVDRVDLDPGAGPRPTGSAAGDLGKPKSSASLAVVEHPLNHFGGGGRRPAGHGRSGWRPSRRRPIFAEQRGLRRRVGALRWSSGSSSRVADQPSLPEVKTQQQVLIC